MGDTRWSLVFGRARRQHSQTATQRVSSEEASHLKHDGSTLPTPIDLPWPTWMAVAILTTALVIPLTAGRASATSTCRTSSPSGGGYSVTVCLDQPAANESLTGVAGVAASVSTTGSPPPLRKLRYTLDGLYLLTDYAPPYQFSLPTSRWVDGSHTLSVVAVFDTFTSQAPSIGLTFSNGVTTPPVNTNAFTPATGTTPGPGQSFVVAAVGDGASGETGGGAVSSLITQWNPNLFLYLGDVYENGSPTEYFNYYGPAGSGPFGQFRSITDPTIGNHEYQLGPTAAGYFDYWDNAPHYYSVDTGGWHLVSLDANPDFNQTQPGTPQYQWLNQDLTASEAVLSCTIVFMHEPVFSQGVHGSDPTLLPLWSLMESRGVDLVLTGHEHNYQRWVPMDGAGQPTPDGLTEMVVGTGGHGAYQIPSPRDTRMAVGFDSGSGALRMELNARGLAFQFVSTSQGVVDSGSIPCRGLSPDTTAPTDPTSLQASAVSSTEIDLSWNASTDDVGVTGYDVYRDGTLLTQIGPQTTYKDTSVSPSTSYTYTVRARDAANNVSNDSNQAAATTPAGSTLIFSDGFESGGLSKWTTSSGLVVQSAQVYSGTYAARGTASGGAGASASETLSTTYTDLYSRTRFRIASLGSTMNLLRVQTAGGTNIATLFVSSSQNLMLRNDVGAANVYSSTKVSLATWHEAQIHLTINGASGHVEVWFDGVQQPQLSLNLNLGTTPMGRLIAGDSVRGRTFDFTMDDVAISSGFIG
jgi:hypothetical protein